MKLTKTFSMACVTCALVILLVILNQGSHMLFTKSTDDALSAVGTLQPKPGAELQRKTEFSRKYSDNDPSSTCDADNAVSSSDDESQLNMIGLSFELLEEILVAESAVRLSADVQGQYSTAHYDFYASITARAQLRAAEQFQHLPEIVHAAELLQVDPLDMVVLLMQTAESLVETDPDKLVRVRELSFYRKFNRCHDGNLKVNDLAPFLKSSYEQSAKPFFSLGFSEVPAVASGKNVFLGSHLSHDTTTVGEMEHIAVVAPNQPLVIIAGSYS
jgi:hypothetical protein